MMPPPPKDGLCTTDPEPWTDPEGYGQTTARQLCAPCPVINECIVYALAAPGWHGVIIAGWKAPHHRPELVPYPKDGPPRKRGKSR